MLMDTKNGDESEIKSCFDWFVGVVHGFLNLGLVLKVGADDEVNVFRGSGMT